MPAVYSKASLFVFPSLYEGFGAPVLEALFSRVPVVASKGGAIEEAGGAGSLFVDPADINELAGAMLKVLSTDGLKKQMSEAGYLHAQTMTDKVFAKKVMKVYKEVMGH
jgi:glycosyltransferase involved in cell wall biosynthesis